MKIPAIRHVRGFDVARPISIGVMLGIMLPLVILPLLSIFLFGTSKGLGVFWSSLIAPEAIFALKLSMVTSFWATVFNVIFGLFAAYVLSRYDFYGRNAVIVTISLPTAIPTAVAGFALLLLWGPSGTLGRLLFPPEGAQLMLTPYATILVSGNLALRTQTAPLYIFAKFNEGQIEAANAIAIVLALLSFVIFSVLFFARDWLEFEAQEK